LALTCAMSLRPGGNCETIWAALIALADQYADCRLGFINPAIDQIACSPRYHQAFQPGRITGFRYGSAQATWVGG
jgi:subtilase family serine protease